MRLVASSAPSWARTLFLPLLLQHVVVLVKYHSKLLYVLAEGVLDRTQDEPRP